MWLVKLAIAYFVAFSVMIGVAPLLELAYLPTVVKLKDHPTPRNLIALCVTAIALFVSIFLVLQLHRIIGVAPAWLMFLVPYGIIIWHDLTFEDASNERNAKIFHRAQTIGSLVGYTAGMMFLTPRGMGILH